jgi:hypothetical protein
MAYNYLQRIAIAGGQSSQPARPLAAAAPQMPARPWLPFAEAIVAPHRAEAPLPSYPVSHQGHLSEARELPSVRSGATMSDDRMGVAPKRVAETHRIAGEAADDPQAATQSAPERLASAHERSSSSISARLAPRPQQVGAAEEAPAKRAPERSSSISQGSKAPDAAQMELPGAPPLSILISDLLSAESLPATQGKISPELRDMISALLSARQRTTIRAPASLRPPHEITRAAARRSSDALALPGTPQIAAPIGQGGPIVPTPSAGPVMPPNPAASTLREPRVTIGRIDVEVNNRPAPVAEAPPKRSSTIAGPSLLDTRYLTRFALRP